MTATSPSVMHRHNLDRVGRARALSGKGGRFGASLLGGGRSEVEIEWRIFSSPRVLPFLA
jgi:hypothetical protein